MHMAIAPAAVRFSLLSVTVACWIMLRWTGAAAGRGKARAVAVGRVTLACWVTLVLHACLLLLPALAQSYCRAIAVVVTCLAIGLALVTPAVLHCALALLPA